MQHLMQPILSRKSEQKVNRCNERDRCNMRAHGEEMQREWKERGGAKPCEVEGARKVGEGAQRQHGYRSRANVACDV